MFSQIFIIFYMSVNFAFLDSGLGGLPYMEFLKKMSPSAECIYVADTKNFPYGQKTEKEIIDNAKNCVQKIIQKWNPEVLVIACNTISVTALEDLRKAFPGTPFVGTVPAIKPAAALSKTRKIGLLATNATVNHPYTKKLIDDFASDCTIISRGDPELISFIEHQFNSASEEERINAVLPAVNFFKEQDCDAIVLACTHFLNMTEYFKQAAGSALHVVDSREGVVRHAMEVEKNDGKKIVESDFHKNSVLYVTGFYTENDLKVYQDICSRKSIVFGGILE